MRLRRRAQLGGRVAAAALIDPLRDLRRIAVVLVGQDTVVGFDPERFAADAARFVGNDAEGEVLERREVD